MMQLRNRALVLTIWLIGLYLLAHFSKLISLSPLIYLYTLVLVDILFAIPHLSRVKKGWLLAIPPITYLCIKGLIGEPLLGIALPTTAIETCSIVFTSLILIWVYEPVHEFENAVTELTFGHSQKVIDTGEEGQSLLYREVRRARNHQRPLAIMAIAIDESTITGSLDRMVKEAQQSILRQFTVTSVSRTLREKLEDCDIVVQTNNHFVVMLPETKPDDLPSLTERIRKLVAEQVGVEIKIGTASLPKDSFTLEGLLDKATLELQDSLGSEFFIEPEQLFIKRKPVDHSS
jgi:GGDEF domain-containing protein